ncbi:MAG: DUF2163 domain-containing protein [Blastocatellia bacterium]|nr:DUF2163 domain-containing protein [Blastocatellia bacterium]
MPVSLDMQTHLAQSLTTLCQAWKVMAQDGTTIRVVSHTRNLTIDGELYTALPIQPAQYEAKSGLAPDNTEVNAILASNIFSEADFLAGKWNFARVEFRVLNYLNPSIGYAQRLVGYFGEITCRNGMFRAELRSLSQLLAQDTGQTTSPHCRVRVLGDSQCKANLATHTYNTSVASVENRRIFTIGVTKADTYFDYGLVTWTSGQNLGYSMEVKRSFGNRIELMLPMSGLLRVGDTLTIIAGCDRTRGTCRDKFSNAINFQGEPDLPGDRRVVHFPE